MKFLSCNAIKGTHHCLACRVKHAEGAIQVILFRLTTHRDFELYGRACIDRPAYRLEVDINPTNGYIV